MVKVLVIRFSSFGDVLQGLSVPSALAQRWPESEIHWVTRQEFEPLIQLHPHVHKVWTLERKSGWRGLWRLGLELRQQRFTHIYDAHNNLRSRVLGWILKGPLNLELILRRQAFIRRPIYRLRRFLLFRLRRNFFPRPFNGQADLLRPLIKWKIPLAAPQAPQLFLSENSQMRARQKLGDWSEKNYVALAPSAAFSLKRWPLKHWKELIATHPHQRFVILGGPEDFFLRELEENFPQNTKNMAGLLSLSESAAVVKMAKALISNDTGLLHVVEQLGRPCVALMGPAPFGFPSRPTTQILEISLPCRPCSKHGQGPCINPQFQKCMVDLAPSLVATELQKKLAPSAAKSERV